MVFPILFAGRGVGGVDSSVGNSSNSSDSSSFGSYAALAVSVVLWGSNLTPLKQFETGDGFFFQFMFAMAAWTSGIGVYLVKGMNNIQWLAVLGGVSAAIANAFTVPIVKLIGIGLGMLLWNSAGLIFGWSVPRFGLFGIKEEVPNIVYLDFMGVAFCLIALFLFFFVTPEEAELKLKKKTRDDEPLLIDAADSNINTNYGSINKPSRDLSEESSIYDKINPALKKLVGVLFALVCGLLIALSYIPILYIENNYPNASQDQNDYALSYNTGLFLGSLVLFIIYCIVNKNQPKVYPEAILPTFIAGIMWMVANTCYFGATNGLSQAITFPISNSVPCSIGFMVGVFYKEVKGWKNFLPLLLGIFFSLLGSTLIGLSR